MAIFESSCSLVKTVATAFRKPLDAWTPVVGDRAGVEHGVTPALGSLGDARYGHHARQPKYGAQIHVPY